jgi:homoserine kinase
LAYQSFCYFFQQTGLPLPTVALDLTLRVPLARGLGSSATAIVGGLVAANQWVGQPWDTQQLLTAATALEGHPDNVAPALLGGCQLSLMTDAGPRTLTVAWPEGLATVAVIPDFSLSTAAARAVLPKTIDRADALFNSSRLGLLVLALAENQLNLLPLALQDRLHQPYRSALIPGMVEVGQAGTAAGAYGVVLSGAGPTLWALCRETDQAAVALAMTEAWAKVGVGARAEILPVVQEGVRIER